MAAVRHFGFVGRILERPAGVMLVFIIVHNLVGIAEPIFMQFASYAIPSYCIPSGIKCRKFSLPLFYHKTPLKGGGRIGIFKPSA